jgi:hypothetical protein
VFCVAMLTVAGLQAANIHLVASVSSDHLTCPQQPYHFKVASPVQGYVMTH